MSFQEIPLGTSLLFFSRRPLIDRENSPRSPAPMPSPEESSNRRSNPQLACKKKRKRKKLHWSKYTSLCSKFFFAAVANTANISVNPRVLPLLTLLPSREKKKEIGRKSHSATLFPWPSLLPSSNTFGGKRAKRKERNFAILCLGRKKKRGRFWSFFVFLAGKGKEKGN